MTGGLFAAFRPHCVRIFLVARRNAHWLPLRLHLRQQTLALIELLLHLHHI